MSSAEIFRWLDKKETMLGSMSPERSPMTSPSRGVSPMLVSTLFPAATAVMLHPFPKWQLMKEVSSKGFPISFAAF